MDDMSVGRINFSLLYESPIEKIVGQIQTQMVKNDEDNIMVQVQQAVGYKVDKEELLKALQYDRGQYEKGYADALSVIEDIKAEISHIATSEQIDEHTALVRTGEQIKTLALKIIDKHISGEGGHMTREEVLKQM